MPVFDFHGLPVAYDQAGSGTPILFLHNIGGDRTIWSEQYRALQATHTVYAIDLFGFGESAIPDSGYTVANYLRLVSEFVTDRGLRDITLVGHCFGSALALLYARAEPHRVRALVLSSPLTAATLRPTPTGVAARTLARLHADRIAGAIRLPGLAADLLVREQLGPRGREMGSNALSGLAHRWTDRRRLLPLTVLARDLPRLAELDEFHPGPGFPPILTLWGADNRILSPAAGARLNTTLDPVRAITLPHCGHLVMLEAPETVTATISSAASSALAG